MAGMKNYRECAAVADDYLVKTDFENKLQW